ncbi:MAG: M1 family metallopeptidase [Bacteroidota bacterium]|nr:M1 family metallopeptidase [Candidatus Kapabacteria bacterium]MDW8221171.1 M1 family metallopeptidase [Bacteroidota bacterium]
MACIDSYYLHRATQVQITVTSFCLCASIWYSTLLLQAQGFSNSADHLTGKFEQLDQLLPTPNTYRTGSGAPGHQYWQQKADYVINVELHDDTQRITGTETITYANNSPDPLTYLWLQLDQNLFAKNSDTYLTQTGSLQGSPSRANPTGNTLETVKALVFQETFNGGYTIASVKDAATGQPLQYTINKTMMRVELPTTLQSGQKYSFSIEWSFNIVPSETRARSCYEYFPQDKNYLYEIAQFFPRMAVYTDYCGWQHKQFLGSGEFTLPFGDYRVSITVPADMVVGATGELQNASAVLTPEQLSRLEKAKSSSMPVKIITNEEALKNESSRTTAKKTWIFHANNVRDFAFCASRKFIWDAMGVDIEGKRVLAMSLYPKEGNPLWEQYSTRAVAHTLRVYSKYTIPYPYPVAISVHGPVFGMEYPMICFNGGRPLPDGTYPEALKYGLISVIIHEVGHNFFPMIINSDERQWTWMDEGLNSFVQFLAEQEWDRNYPSRRGPARNIVEYMKADKTRLVPIMTNSEQILEMGNNAYGKPATALNILRETIMGRELFDYAFKEYARRWAFKHPTPADFFRTMEDASGVDLDWFWRGWFYTTDYCDIALERVTRYDINTQNPEIELAKDKAEAVRAPLNLTVERNKRDIPATYVEQHPEALDYYDTRNRFVVQPWSKEQYEQYLATLTDDEKALVHSGKIFYELEFANKGGLVMPIILELTYEDGTKEIRRFPAEIWRYNPQKITKVIMVSKPVASFLVDPYLETADVDMSNNALPLNVPPTRFQVYKQQRVSEPNEMRLQRLYEERSKSGTGTK